MNSKRMSFSSSMIIIGISSIINMIIGFLTAPIITRLVDPDVYGQLSIFTMYSSIAVMVLCLGLDQALVRFYYESNDEKYKRELFRECVILPLTITLCLGLILVFLVALGVLKFEFNSFITVFLVLDILFVLAFRFTLLTIRLSHRNGWYAFLNIISRLSYIILAIVLLRSYSFGDFATLVIATTASGAIAFIGSVFLQIRFFSFKKVINIEQYVSFKDLIRYAYPFVFSMGITSIFQGLDKMSLNWFCTYSEVGIYSSAMTLVHIFAIIQTSFNTVWAPVALEHHAKKPNDTLYYKKAFEGITVIMFTVGISLILIKDVFALLLGEKYREAAYILPFLIFNPIMYTISETTVCGIDFAKKSKLHVVIAIISCFINATGNILLVPLFGGKGAAISTGISYIAFFALRTFFGEKLFNSNLEFDRFFIITLLSVIYAFYNTFFEFNWFSIFFACICFISIGILYWKTIKWLASYFKNSLFRIIRKRIGGEKRNVQF